MNEWNDLWKPEVLWAVAGLVMLAAEFVLPGLIIFFFGVGALVVAAVCLFADISFNLQLVVFVVSSVVLLAALRRWMRGIFAGHTADAQDPAENLKPFVGERAVVQARIEPHKEGRVELNGATWRAEADEVIEAGTEVEVVDQLNLTVRVKPRQ